MLQSLEQVAMGTETHLAHSFWQPHRDHWKDEGGQKWRSLLGGREDQGGVNGVLN